MKKSVLLMALLIVIMLLTACGSKGNNAAQNEASAQQAANAAQVEPAVDEMPLLSSEKVAAQLGVKGEPEVETASAAAPAKLTSASADEDRPVDLDLSALSGTVVYSQVYDMVENPDRYMGQKIRVKGNFTYFRNEDTRQEYFAAVIADATACCAQGIEFLWAGDHVYPRDYPPLDTEITVTGTFNTYEEDGYAYLQLTDADLVWNG